MAPGVGSLPPAAGPASPLPGAIDVAEPLNRYLTALPHRTVRRIGLALRAFDRLPFPWRFSRASLEARQDFLAKVGESGWAPVRDLTLFLKVLAGLGYGNIPQVRAAVGYEMRCELAT